jgi:hypothetical protein
MAMNLACFHVIGTHIAERFRWGSVGVQKAKNEKRNARAIEQRFQGVRAGEH